MRHAVSELNGFPSDSSLWVNINLIKRSSPDSLSITELKNALEPQILEKMLAFPLLGEDIPGSWQVTFRQELNMTSDSDLFYTEPLPGCLPLYEGKMIWQFQHGYAAPRYWIDEDGGRERVLGTRVVDRGQTLDYQMYRLGFRDIARSTDTRSFISTVIPQCVFAGNKVPTVVVLDGAVSLIDNATQIFACAVWNSFVLDYAVRQKGFVHIEFLLPISTPRSALSPRRSLLQFHRTPGGSTHLHRA